VFAELARVLVKQLPQSLSLLRIESLVDRMRMLRTWAKCFREPLLVEGMDGVACRLWIAAQLVSDLVGVFVPVASEQDLAERRKVKASGERKPASRVLRSASLTGRTKFGRFIE
jgi:hypothetical protein